MDFFDLLKKPTLFDPFKEQKEFEKLEEYSLNVYNETNNKNFLFIKQPIDSFIKQTNLLVEFSIMYESFTTKRIIAKNFSIKLDYPKEKKGEYVFYDGELYIKFRLRGIDMNQKVISADCITFLNGNDNTGKIDATGHEPICSAKLNKDNIIIINSRLYNKVEKNDKMINVLHLIKITEL